VEAAGVAAGVESGGDRNGSSSAKPTPVAGAAGRRM
jgi:hypothetical protein